MAAVSMGADVALSTIDESRFGVRVARAHVRAPADVEEILAFAQASQARLVIARADTRALPSVHALERARFLLMETTVRWVVSLAKDPPVVEVAGIVRSIRGGEAEEVRRIALRSFETYEGHYGADPRLDREKCRDLYGDWAYRSCVVDGVADDVYVTEVDGRLVSFMSVAVGPPETWSIPLSGTLRDYQRLGFTRAMIVHTMREARARGGRRLVVVTGLDNFPVARHLLRLGFRPKGATHTFHLWTDASG